MLHHFRFFSSQPFPPATSLARWRLHDVIGALLEIRTPFKLGKEGLTTLAFKSPTWLWKVSTHKRRPYPLRPRESQYTILSSTLCDGEHLKAELIHRRSIRNGHIEVLLLQLSQNGSRYLNFLK